MTPEEAIFDVRERMVRVETVLTGVAGTKDKGLCGDVDTNTLEIDATRKKLGRLEIRLWILVAFLMGSGIVNGFALHELVQVASASGP